MRVFTHEDMGRACRPADVVFRISLRSDDAPSRRTAAGLIASTLHRFGPSRTSARTSSRAGRWRPSPTPAAESVQSRTGSARQGFGCNPPAAIRTSRPSPAAAMSHDGYPVDECRLSARGADAVQTNECQTESRIGGPCRRAWGMTRQRKSPAERCGERGAHVVEQAGAFHHFLWQGRTPAFVGASRELETVFEGGGL